MSILDAITGPKVRITGFALTGVGGLLLMSVNPTIGLVYLGWLAVALVGFYTKTFNWLSNFADPQFWPAFVGLGVCVMLAAHSGGLFGMLACVGPLTAYDGMYFDQNY